DGGVSVFLGARGVPFLPRVDYPAPTSGPSGIALGDLTGDGVLDVAVSNLSTHQVLVYVGDGAGGLSAPTPFSTGAASMAIAVADLDGDGRLDAVTANSSAGTLSFLAGDGGGGLAAPTPLAAGAGASSVTVGDLDDDGRPDLLCANSTANTISVLLRNPGGGFLPKVDYATPAQPMSIALGDGNGDGRLDALVACAGTALVSHRFGLGGGALGVATDFTMAANAASALYVDLDGDGLHDLASSTISGDALSIRSGDGSGGFGVRRDYTAATLGASSLGGSAGVATADWDADGRLDVGIATRHFFTPIGNLTQPAPSTAAFGVGTPGCAGTLGVAAGGSPTIGGPFRLLSTQAPPDSLGLGLLSFGPDFAGTDLLGIGLVLHVDLAGPALLALDATTDPAGVGVMAFTIPPVPLLAGLTAYFQAIYVLPSCPAIPFGLMSTRGLAITYQS
ncbi:MAG TPA: VCBS repeat-containing protein, partial [Planctomycetota bacterium]|nr:VCBS repeat-containing protein [Planctomycetota bacterium]